MHELVMLYHSSKQNMMFSDTLLLAAKAKAVSLQRYIAWCCMPLISTVLFLPWHRLVSVHQYILEIDELNTLCFWLAEMKSALKKSTASWSTLCFVRVPCATALILASIVPLHSHTIVQSCILAMLAACVYITVPALLRAHKW